MGLKMERKETRKRKRNITYWWEQNYGNLYGNLFSQNSILYNVPHNRISHINWTGRSFARIFNGSFHDTGIVADIYITISVIKPGYTH